MTQTAEPKTEHPNLEIVRDCVRGHFQVMTDKLWGEYGSRGRALRFTPTGLSRLAATFGWLLGLANAGQVDVAESLAKDLIENLDYLANYGGYLDKRKYYPHYIVELADDDFNEWRIAWHRATKMDTGSEHQQTESFKKSLYRLRPSNALYLVPTFYVPEDPLDIHGYVYNMNGGLNYSGPGAGEFQAVTFSHKAWSINT
jgi:hypothetical protein